jgi:hypothetical protein
MGFEYSVTFSDLSGTDSWNFASGAGQAAGAKVRIARACNLAGGDGFVRPALLTVEAWRIK